MEIDFTKISLEELACLIYKTVDEAGIQLVAKRHKIDLRTYPSKIFRRVFGIILAHFRLKS